MNRRLDPEKMEAEKRRLGQERLEAERNRLMEKRRSEKERIPEIRYAKPDELIRKEESVPMTRQVSAEKYYRPEEKCLPAEKKKRKSAVIFLRVMEVLTVGTSFLASSRIARFLTAKITMDVVVEVTDRFGKNVAHALTTTLAMIVAEPRIIAFTVTGVILGLNAIVWSVRGIRRLFRKRH